MGGRLASACAFRSIAPRRFMMQNHHPKSRTTSKPSFFTPDGVVGEWSGNGVGEKDSKIPGGGDWIIKLTCSTRPGAWAWGRDGVDRVKPVGARTPTRMVSCSCDFPIGASPIPFARSSLVRAIPGLDCPHHGPFFFFFFGWYVVSPHPSTPKCVVDVLGLPRGRAWWMSR